MLSVWDAAATMTGDLKGELPEDRMFASWVEHFALPRLLTQIESRAIDQRSDTRVLIVDSPFHFCASTDGGKNGFSLHAWQAEPNYVWTWTEGAFQVISSPQDGVTNYYQVDGWKFGNIGLYKDGSWVMTHMPSGLNFGAGWRKVKSAKSGVEAIHAQFNLEQVDRFNEFSKNRKKLLQAAINKHQEFKI